MNSIPFLHIISAVQPETSGCFSLACITTLGAASITTISPSFIYFPIVSIKGEPFCNPAQVRIDYSASDVASFAASVLISSIAKSISTATSAMSLAVTSAATSAAGRFPDCGSGGRCSH